VRGDEFACDARLGDPEDNRDALGRLERQIEPGDRTVGRWRAKLGTGCRITRGEQMLDAARVDLATETQRMRPGTEPPARRLALAVVIVLAPLRDLLDVVTTRGRSRCQLADRKHLPLKSRERPNTPTEMFWRIGDLEGRRRAPRRRASLCRRWVVPCRALVWL